MNGVQHTTGTVHRARPAERRDLPPGVRDLPAGRLAPACQRPGKARYWIARTDLPVTCRRCAALPA